MAEHRFLSHDQIPDGWDAALRKETFEPTQEESYRKKMKSLKKPGKKSKKEKMKENME